MSEDPISQAECVNNKYGMENKNESVIHNDAWDGDNLNVSVGNIGNIENVQQCEKSPVGKLNEIWEEMGKVDMPSIMPRDLDMWAEGVVEPTTLDIDSKKKKISTNNTEKRKVWTKLRNGLFGWRIIKSGVRSKRKEKQAEGEHAKSKSGRPDVIVSTEVLTGENNIGTGSNNIKRKIENEGWETKLGQNGESERHEDYEDWSAKDAQKKLRISS